MGLGAIHITSALFFYSFHGLLTDNLACSQCMGLHSSIGGALQHYRPWVRIQFAIATATIISSFKIYLSAVNIIFILYGLYRIISPQEAAIQSL